MNFYQFLSIDFPPLIATTAAAIACASLGNYLILRKLSLMGDAISHSVLPGIVLAFLLSSSRDILPIFLGAALAGTLSAITIEAVRRYGRVESGTSMGVVFSIFFALGVLLMELAAARNVDLDADCLLHGQLEGIFWYPPETIG
ncbi:MAG: metal ABC transporter permease, partial [Bdellovibrionales bacterium]|nr:metal ABC transporter permease [Bdellovibrionales bacterium]